MFYMLRHNWLLAYVDIPIIRQNNNLTDRIKVYKYDLYCLLLLMIYLMKA